MESLGEAKTSFPFPEKEGDLSDESQVEQMCHVLYLEPNPSLTGKVVKSFLNAYIPSAINELREGEMQP